MSVFHEVTVYKPNGKLKEVITREQLEKRHWAKFLAQEANDYDRNSFLKQDPTLKLDFNLREL